MLNEFYDLSRSERVDKIVEYLKNVLNEKDSKKIGTSDFLRLFAIKYNITFEYARESLYYSMDDNKIKLNNDYSLSLV